MPDQKVLMLPGSGNRGDTSALGRIPALDGFRALAVLAVFLTHAGSLGQFYVLGQYGVTLFFFISGFVITTLLRSEFERRGHIDLHYFMLRRINRLLPSLYIVIALAILYTLAGYSNIEPDLSRIAANIFHYTNYHVIFGEPTRNLVGTGPLWSLSVEAHMYLVFPAALLYMLRQHSYKTIAKVLLALCAAMLLWRCWLFFAQDVPMKRIALASDTRIDSILFGCVLGLVGNPWMGDSNKIADTRMNRLAVLGIIATAATLLADPQSWITGTVGYTIQGLTLMGVLSIAIRRADRWYVRWLNWSPVVGFGLISYTVYLSHGLAINVAERLLNESAATTPLALLITTVFSVLMYYVVEMRVAEFTRRLGRRRAAAQADPSAEQSPLEQHHQP